MGLKSDKDPYVEKTAMLEKRLENQRAVITGASAGIGAFIAERHAAERDEIGLKRVIEACRVSGVVADGRSYDLPEASRASDIIREEAKFLGGLDILVNCAGARAPGPVTEFKDDEIICVFHVNAIFVFIASREAARLRSPKGADVSLNIGSIFGEVGVAENAL